MSKPAISSYISNIPSLVVLSSDDEDDDITYINSPQVLPPTPTVQTKSNPVSTNNSSTSLDTVNNNVSYDHLNNSRSIGLGSLGFNPNIYASNSHNPPAINGRIPGLLYNKPTQQLQIPISNRYLENMPNSVNFNGRIPGLLPNRSHSQIANNFNNPYSPNASMAHPVLRNDDGQSAKLGFPKRQKISSNYIGNTNNSSSVIDLTADSDGDDDDIIIIDPKKVPITTKFKSSLRTSPDYHVSSYSNVYQNSTTMNSPTVMSQMSKNENAFGFNSPAPVPHFDGSSNNVTDADDLTHKQLQMKLNAILQEKLSTTREIAQISNLRGNIANDINMQYVKIGDWRVERKFLADQENDDLKARITDLDRRIADATRTINAMNVKQSGLSHRSRLLESSLASASYREMYARSAISAHASYKGEVHDDNDVYNRSRGSLEMNPNIHGYATNIYSGTDEKSLQDLLENIRPDEEIDEKGLSLTPSEMTVNLLKHQRMGLSWLLRMEESNSAGGILADDMGLGKTVQTISLLMANRSKNEDLKTNLVIAPVALLKQWSAEIESKVKADAHMKVRIYHSAAKRDLYDFKRLSTYDVILTSYGTLSSEMKKHYDSAIKEAGISRNSSIVPDVESGGDTYISPFFSSESIFYRVILDEAQWIKNKTAQASKAVALLKSKYRLCLSGTPMQNSVDELYPLIRFLKIKPYDNEGKFRSDIVLPLKSKTDNYDETDKSRATRKLQAFLKAILLRRTKDSKIDGEPILSLPPKHIDETYVVMDKDEKSFYESLEDHSAKKAKALLNNKGAGAYSNVLTLLLRLRQACCHQYLVKIGQEEAKEKVPYDWLGAFTRASKFSDSVIRRINRETLNSDESQETPFSCPICFDVVPSEEIMLLHPCGHGICKECVGDFFDRFQNSETINGQRSAKCALCQLNVQEGHTVPFQIFDQSCNQKLSQFEMSNYYNKASKRVSRKQRVFDMIKEENNTFIPSAKLKKTVQILEEIRDKFPGEKVIIFSQFTLLFEVMHYILKKKEIQYLRYDGSMSMDERNETIRRFYQEDKEVLLISLRSGNVGLTLTCASHVIMMDPFWNPFVEEQAMDRAHRIGQQREVHVHRILIKDTVESRIMELQQKKKDMVNSALDEKGMKHVSNLGRKELGFLFGLNSL